MTVLYCFPSLLSKGCNVTCNQDSAKFGNNIRLPKDKIRERSTPKTKLVKGEKRGG